MGWLKIQGNGHSPSQLAAFREGMKALGYAEGSAYVIEQRFADNDAHRLPGLARELVAHGVDVIVATSQPSIMAAATITKRVPIIGRMNDDPVANRMAASLSKPGGNITGIYAETEALNSKRLEFLGEIVRGIRKVAVLYRADWPSAERSWKATRAAAGALGIALLPFDVHDRKGLEPAFRTMSDDRVEGLLTFRNPTVVTYYKEITSLANQHHLPAIYDASEFAVAGGLASYGPNIDAIYRRLASFVDKLLKGVPASALPIEQPSVFEFVVNRRTAQALNIPLSRLVLAHADRIID